MFGSSWLMMASRLDCDVLEGPGMEVGEGSEDLAVVDEAQEGGTVVVDEGEGGVTVVEDEAQEEGPIVVVVVVVVDNVAVETAEVSVDVD